MFRQILHIWLRSRRQLLLFRFENATRLLKRLKYKCPRVLLCFYFSNFFVPYKFKLKEGAAGRKIYRQKKKVWWKIKFSFFCLNFNLTLDFDYYFSHCRSLNNFSMFSFENNVSPTYFFEVFTKKYATKILIFTNRRRTKMKN